MNDPHAIHRLEPPAWNRAEAYPPEAIQSIRERVYGKPRHIRVPPSWFAVLRDKFSFTNSNRSAVDAAIIAPGQPLARWRSGLVAVASAQGNKNSGTAGETAPYFATLAADVRQFWSEVADAPAHHAVFGLITFIATCVLIYGSAWVLVEYAL